VQWDVSVVTNAIIFDVAGTLYLNNTQLNAEALSGAAPIDIKVESTGKLFECGSTYDRSRATVVSGGVIQTIDAGVTDQNGNQLAAESTTEYTVAELAGMAASNTTAASGQTLIQMLQMLCAATAGLADYQNLGDDTARVVVYKADGATEAFHFDFDTTTGDILITTWVG